MKIGKKILKIILAVLAVLIIIAIAVVVFVLHIIGDSNGTLKNKATEVTAGEEYPGKFRSTLKLELAVSFLEGLDEVLCIEELDPVIERELTYIAGKYHLNVTIRGKLSGDITPAGENSTESVAASLNSYSKIALYKSVRSLMEALLNSS